MLAPLAVSLPFPRWARSHCRYPTDQLPPHTGFSPRQGRCTATCPTTSDPAFLLGRPPMLPRVPRLRILPPCSGGSGAATCHVAPNPSSLLKRALALPCVPWLWILPPCLGGLRHCHVSHDTELVSLLGRASTLPRVPQLSVGHIS
jgi:hypothetical protein